MMWEGRVEHVVWGQAQRFQGCLHRGRIKGYTPHPTKYAVQRIFASIRRTGL
jgi:hypothetical protein